MLFLFGRFEGNGYALKFNKETALVNYRLGFHDPGSVTASHMHDILSAAQPVNGDYVMACGLAFYNPTNHNDPRSYATLVNFKRTTGEVVYIRSWGEASFQSNEGDGDKCRSITYD